MDLIGCASYAVPFLGEVIDLVWAPISALIFYFSFGGRTGFLGAIFDFTEEILPGTDFIPTFTIAWFLQNIQKKKAVQKKSIFGGLRV
jgi:hypothetical protein